MVANRSKEINNIIKEFFKDNLQNYILQEENVHGPNWALKYMGEDLIINIQGDIGFFIDVIIDDNTFELWRYDKSVNQYAKTSPKNIKYQLSVLRDFLQ